MINAALAREKHTLGITKLSQLEKAKFSVDPGGAVMYCYVAVL